MNNLVRWLLGTGGLCLTWAAGWAVTGVLIGAASVALPFLPWEPFFKIFDAPLPALGMPGFIGGAFFSALIGLAERRRGPEALSPGRLAAWGAVAGLLLGLLPAAMVAAGLATLNHPAGLWRLTAVILGPLILLGGLSGFASLLLARAARPWKKLLALLLPG